MSADRYEKWMQKLDILCEDPMKAYAYKKQLLKKNENKEMTTLEPIDGGTINQSS